MHVKALPGFRLRLRFSDGTEGVFDCAKELWGEVFEPLKDPQYFAKVFLDHGAPSWPNGADFDPGQLREDIKPTPASRKTAARKLRPAKSAAVREEQTNYLRKKSNQG